MRTFLLVAVLASACDNNSSSGTDPDAPPSQCDDVDQDGITTCDGDCDDTTALTAPGADELCGDGEDNNCDGNIDEDCAAGVGTFVSAMTGDDANPGTAAAPVKTIAKGIANAMLLGGERSVVIGEGSYAEKVRLVEGIDLLGGHQCNAQACDWTRDLVTFKSTIANTDFEGVVAGAGITQATLISGFTITGMAGAPTTPAGTTAVTLDGGSPTLRGNVIAGASLTNSGSEANNRSVGLAIRAAAGGALIENNDISSGTAAQSVGLWIDGQTASLVTINANIIRSGTARRSVGVLALRAKTGSTIANNDITSGSSAGGASIGLQVNSPVAVDRNRINLDRTATGTCTQAQGWCTAILVEGATTTLTNNVALGPKGQRTTGLLLAELELPAGTVTVANNYFDGGGSGPNGTGGQRNTSSAIVLQISATAGLTGMVGRISNNILNGGVNSDRFGIREEAAQNREIHPTFVNANFFTFSAVFNRTDRMYREWSDSGFPIDYSSIFLFENNSGVPADGNDDGDPALDATFHLTDDSPCIDTGVSTDAPAKDFEGDTRPSGQGVDIGPDEL